MIHKLINGTASVGALFLPFALSKLRALVKLVGPKGYASQKYRVPDSYNDGFGPAIMVQVAGSEQFIRIDVPVRYEFYTSDHITSDLVTYGRADTYNPGSATRAIFSGKHTPLFSSVLPSPDPAPGVQTWAFTDPADNPGPTDPEHRPWRSWGAWQNQKFFEHVNWPNNGTKSMVTSCQAQAPGLLSQCGWWSAYGFCRFANAHTFISDIGLDVKPTYYDAVVGSMAGAPAYDNDRVWWRRAAVQSSGGRKFFICTDNYGRFQVYPVLDYFNNPDLDWTALQENTHYRMYTPPYPGWVTLPDVDDANVQNHQWLWSFNKDATKAVTCPFNATESSDFYKKDYGIEVSSIGETYLPNEIAFIGPTLPTREDIPGLVEMGITVNVTGEEAMDFTVDFSLISQEYCGSSGRFIFDAGYSLPDVSKSMGIEEDTLITAEITCFGDYDPGPTLLTWDSGGVDPWTQTATHSVKGMDAYFKLVANLENGSKEEIKKLTLITSVSIFMLAPGAERGLYDPSLISPLAIGNHRFPPRVPAPAFGDRLQRVFTSIFALDVRTASVSWLTEDTYTKKVTYGMMVRGKEEILEENPFAGGDFETYPPHVPSFGGSAIPTTAVPLYMYALGACLDTPWGSGFSVHPAGHWSHCANAGWNENSTFAPMLDIISPRVGGPGSERTSHRKVYNKAFNQSREQSYYAEDFDGKGVRWDYGSFRTHGIWISF